MDVKDDNRDIRLYRASGDLIPEIRAKLPQLVWAKSSANSNKFIRRWVLDSKVEELIYLVSNPSSPLVSLANRLFSAYPIPRMASTPGSSSSRSDTAVGRY